LKRAIPGPSGLQLFSSLRDIRHDRLGFVLKIARRYGDVAGFRMGWRTLLLVNHPDAVRHVLRDNVRNYQKGIGLAEAKPLLGNGLLTSEDSAWAAQRQRLHQVFHADRMAGFAEASVAAASSRLELWEKAGLADRELDIPEEMTRLTLEILGRTLLRGNLADEADLVSSLDMVERWAIRKMVNPLALPAPASFRVRRALSRLDAIVRSLVEAHRRDPRPEGEGDALDALLSAEGEVDAGLLRDEVVTLLIAGHETSASALAWTWYLISLNPAVRDRLEDELATVLAGRLPTFADVSRLEYTRMVAQEALRLYPPVWMLPRRALAEDEILGHPVPAGADVLISPYTLHRHPGFWHAPDEFLPERFTPGSASYPAAAYLPFGQGPRACLGSALGMLEVVLVVATVAARYRLDLAPGCRPSAEALLTLKPRGLRMRLRRRV
jgi:cytochrome P450